MWFFVVPLADNI